MQLLVDETQNETQQESSVQTLMPEPFLADIARENDDEELEYTEPFGRSHQDLKKPLKLPKHPLNGNSHNEERIYMHLIPETRQMMKRLATKSLVQNENRRKLVPLSQEFR